MFQVRWFKARITSYRQDSYLEQNKKLGGTLVSSRRSYRSIMKKRMLV